MSTKTTTANVQDTPSTDMLSHFETSHMNPLELSTSAGCGSALPDGVFPALPDDLQEITSLYGTKRERDLMLLTMLTGISSGLYNIQGNYYHTRYRPSLFTVVTGPPVSSKGLCANVVKLCKPLEKIVRDEDAATDNLFHFGTQEDEWLPPVRSHFIPIDISEAAFKQALAAHDGRGLMFATEIGVLLDMNVQKWGLKPTTLLKAAEHEAIDVGRVDYRLEIDKPGFAMLMTGTPEPTRAFLGTSNSGLHSRFVMYQFNERTPWRNQRPTDGFSKAETLIDRLGNELAAMYDLLEAREKALAFEMPHEAWEMHTDAYDEFLCQMRQLFASNYVDSVVKRNGVAAFRMAMILAAVRAHRQDECLRTLGRLSPTPPELHVAICIAQHLCVHMLRFLEKKLPTNGALGKVHSSSSLPQFVEMLELFPEEFKRDMAVKQGVSILEISESAVDRHLKDLLKTGVLEKAKYGVYRKVGDKVTK